MQSKRRTRWSRPPKHPARKRVYWRRLCHGHYARECRRGQACNRCRCRRGAPGRRSRLGPRDPCCPALGDRVLFAGSQEGRRIVRLIANGRQIESGVGEFRASSDMLLCEDDLRRAIAQSKKIYTGPRSIVTPSARDLAPRNDTLVMTEHVKARKRSVSK